ncbi:MAG: sigma-54-dependent Fis family transcriptional regulator [Gammaproteobacteria bacterium]|nr:MAG: sigma-54-dependent Fis family transcriptional regulator [Gammaproteobacteria bacterium]
MSLAAPERSQAAGQPAPARVLLVDDDATLGRLLARQLAGLGYTPEVAATAAEARAAVAAHRPDAVLLDQRLPDADGMDLVAELARVAPVVVLTAYGSVDQAVAAVRAGAADYLTKPITPAALELVLARVLEMARLRGELGRLRRAIGAQEPPELVGSSPEMVQLRRRASALAEGDVPALIAGEWGTGKRTVARFIHHQGPRRDGPFHQISCVEHSAETLMAELVGDEEPGLLELAAGGTLYLADIGRAPAAAQRQIAVIIESGAFARRGSAALQPLRARILAGVTLASGPVSGRREIVPELFFLLSGMTLEVPPLRQRRKDIPELAQNFLKRRSFARDRPKRLSSGALRRLCEWDWPGNLRELQGVIERAVILSGESPNILPRHVELNAVRPGEPAGALDVSDEPDLDRLAERYLDLLLERHGGNRRRVARIMGISERSIYRMLSRRRDQGGG